jgi:hypothetical protein
MYIFSYERDPTRILFYFIAPSSLSGCSKSE